MAEPIGRLIFALAAAVLVAPILLVLATPFVLLAPILHDVPERRYWLAVRRGYANVLRRVFDWGASFFDL